MNTRIFQASASALAVLLLSGLSLPGNAQQGEFEAYEAVVVADDTPIRSGAGRAYYEVGMLREGDVVQVEDELFGWYKITAPEGVYSFVERKNVDAKGDGSWGLVNTNRTMVNAAHASKGPADSYRSQGDLDKGDRVEIVGQKGNAYKIIPPEGAYVFLPPRSVERASDMRPSVAEVESNETKKPVETASAEATAQPEPVRTITPAQVVVNPPAPIQRQPAATQSQRATVAEAAELAETVKAEPAKPAEPKIHPKLAAVEDAIGPYFDLPVDEQPFDKMVEGYAAASAVVGLSRSDVRLIQDRLQTIERDRELAEALGEPEPPAPVAVADAGVPVVDPEIAALTTPAEGTTPEADTMADSSDAEPAPTPIAELAEPMDEVAITPAASLPTVTRSEPTELPSFAGTYDAVGILAASTVHTGSNQPELLRLIDPTVGRTLAYVEPGGEIDTAQMVGRLVGITGTATYDPTSKLKLFQVASVDVLGPSR
jgi:hypothetical protein